MFLSTSISALRKLLEVMASYLDVEIPKQPDPAEKLQVINFGLSHTGTASINSALEILGFGPTYQGLALRDSNELNEKFTNLVDQVNAGHLHVGPVLSAHLHDIMKGRRSACDQPVNQLVPEFLEAYPNAKYILSTHEGGRDAWWKAFSQSYGLHWRKDWSYQLFRFLIYPITFIRRHDDLAQAEGRRMMQKYGTLGPDLYDLHMDDVECRVPKKQLLLFNVKDGWDPLCKFLNCKVPNQPFPAVDENSRSKAIYAGMHAYGAVVWACYAGAAASLLFFAMRPEITTNFLSRSWPLGKGFASHLLGLK